MLMEGRVGLCEDTNKNENKNDYGRRKKAKEKGRKSDWKIGFIYQNLVKIVKMYTDNSTKQFSCACSKNRKKRTKLPT